MSGFLRIAGLLLVGLTLLFAPGCDNDDANWGQVGVVYFADVGGTCWVIVVEDGPSEIITYEATNLEDRFRVDGLLVRFEFVIPEEWVSTCMVGQGIIITRIEEL